jgi:hypothetical protein
MWGAEYQPCQKISLAGQRGSCAPFTQVMTLEILRIPRTTPFPHPESLWKTMSLQQSRLLTVPREIRDQIYHEYLFNENGYVFDFSAGKLRSARAAPVDALGNVPVDNQEASLPGNSVARHGRNANSCPASSRLISA